jgi:hypothetical protein
MKTKQLIKYSAGAAWLVASLSVDATTITIVNADGANEGFNDTAAASPIGGNPGTTLGAQRLKVFEQAAAVWASRIHSDVEIKVEAKFDPLSCSSNSAVLGSAGANTVHRDFQGAPVRATWYPQALANSIAGTDLSASNPDLGATFNSAIDNNNNCLININWYLGLDGNAGNHIDLLDVVIHEIGHGLGFASYVNEDNGTPFLNYLDIYSINLEDHSTGRNWDQMTNTQRTISAVDSGDLHFNGAYVSSSHGGHAPMYAPNPVRPGSSVSHFDTSMNPDELMEPFIAQAPIHNPGLAQEVMLDLGWALANQPGNTAPEVSIDSPLTGQEFNEGEGVTLQGSANDAQDSLSPLLIWSSDRDGDLGSGSPQTVSDLSPGSHLITATATDSEGVSATDQVSITILTTAAVTPIAPSAVTATDQGNGSAMVTWTDRSNNETRFDIVRESPHKKRKNVWVGSTLVGSVGADVTSITDASGAGTFRYCVSASNTAGSSTSVCSETVVITDSGDGGGGGGGGSFCDTHPGHRRCTN